MGMFDKFDGIPSDVTGFRKLKAAVQEKKVRNKDAKAALRAIAAERTNAGPDTKLGKALAACEAGDWKAKKDSGEDAPEPKAKAKAKAPKAKAPAKAQAKAQAPETETDDLDGMAWDDLRALGKSLGVKAKSRQHYCERIRAARAAKAKPAAKAAKADMPDMPSPEVLAGAMKALGAWLAHQQ